MERVYLLLRNNQQTGPFTIGELLQQQLTSSDMLWIEGKSSAWTYLTELELSPFVHNDEVPKQEGHFKKEDEIERKAEELRQRVLASSPRTYFPKYVTEIETYASPYDSSKEEINFVDHRKERVAKRNAVFGELFLTCLVISLFVLGIYKGKSFLGINDKVQPSVATQLDTGDEHTAQKAKAVKQDAPVIQDTLSKRVNDSLVASEKVAQRALLKRRIIDSALAMKPVVDKVAITDDKKEDTESAHPQQVVPPVKETPVKKEVTSALPETKANIEPVKEEKKGFLRGLFKKHKNAKGEKGEDKEQ